MLHQSPPRASGVASGGFSYPMTGEGVSCPRGRNTGGQPAGGRPALWGLHRLSTLFSGFWLKQPFGKEHRVALAGGTCWHGMWPTWRMMEFQAAGKQPIRRGGDGGMGGRAAPPCITPPTVRELSGVLLPWRGSVEGAAVSVSCLQRFSCEKGPGAPYHSHHAPSSNWVSLPPPREGDRAPVLMWD